MGTMENVEENRRTMERSSGMIDEQAAREAFEKWLGYKPEMNSDTGQMFLWDAWLDAWQEATVVERGRCAEIAKNFAKHYPMDIFTEPSQGEHGKTVDACSAKAIRIICPSIAREIEEEPRHAGGTHKKT